MDFVAWCQLILQKVVKIRNASPLARLKGIDEEEYGYGPKFLVQVLP
jgi:hypothetical protein